MLTANDVVDDIAKGVLKSLQTSEFLLGAEAIDTEHPEINAEYLVTVEVAKQLSGPDRVVGLETHMDDLRTNARRKAEMKAMLKFTSRTREERKIHKVQREARIAEIETIISSEEFQFGGKGSGKKRVDIVVFPPDQFDPPLLIAEAKLGSQAPDKIIADIDRVIVLLSMYRKLGMPENIYGAVFFYRMLKGGSNAGVRGRAKNLLARIDAHLIAEKRKPNREWLKTKTDLMSRGSVATPVHAYEELHDDGTSEMVFSRKGYAFAPGLVLLGSSEDVETVDF